MELSEKALRQEISSGKLHPVYFIKGDDGYLKQQLVNYLAGSVVPAGLEAFNFHKLKGEETSPDQISEYVEALPAMCEHTCVLVHDYDFNAADSSDKQKMIELLTDPPETCVLVFWQDTVGANFKSADAKKIYDLLMKNGVVCNISKPTQYEFEEQIVSICNDNGKKIDRQTATYLAECVGSDMSTLITETTKVCAYSKDTITRAKIDEVVTKTPEATVFQIVDFLLVNNFDGAFNALQILFDQKTDSLMILGAIVSNYSDMYRVKVLQELGYKPSELSKYYPKAYKSDFKIRKAVKNSSKFTIVGLRACLEAIYDADRKLKSRSDDERTIIEKLIIELALAGRKK